MPEFAEGEEAQKLAILLKQYEVCAHHHLGFYHLIWQIPAVAITIGGGLATVVFSTEMPVDVRAILLVVGATFMGAMTIALERFRMFQRRRRKDIQEIEGKFEELGVRGLRWEGKEIVNDVGAGDISDKGIPLYRLEGFQVLRAMMYLITVALALFAALSVAAVGGWITLA